MTTISLPHLHSAVGVVSLSATVAQKEAAKFLLGKNYLKILEGLEKLSKSKVVVSPNIRGFMLMLRDAEDAEIIKFQKSVSGKATIKALQDLAKAKTLDAGLKALKGIKVAKNWQELAGRTKNVAKPVPKVKPAKKPKPAPEEKPVLKLGEETRKPEAVGTPQISDHHTGKKNIAEGTKFGNAVNVAIAVFHKLGLTVNDTDVTKANNGAYMISLQENKSVKGQKWALQITQGGKFIAGSFDEKGRGTAFEEEASLAKSCMKLKAAIDKQNSGTTTAGTAPKKTELTLIDEISDVMPQTLAKNFLKYGEHVKAIGENLCRNIPGLSYKIRGDGMELTYGSGAFGTLEFNNERWTLHPYQRTHAIKDIGQFYDAGYVIETLNDMFAVDKKIVAKQKAVGTMNPKLLRAKEELMTSIATSSMKVFDEVPVPNLTDSENIVWDCSYKIPGLGVSLPIRFRFNAQKGFTFALNGHPAFKTLTPGIAHNTYKFVKGVISTVAAFVRGCSKQYVLTNGRAYNPGGDEIIMTFDSKVEIRITGNSIFIIGSPAHVGAIYQSRFRNALENSNDAASLTIIAPNNYKVVCKNDKVRDKVMLDAMIIQKV